MDDVLGIIPPEQRNVHTKADSRLSGMLIVAPQVRANEGRERGRNDMPLYHFSEDPMIARFVPRSPLARPEVEPLVWAINDWHAPLYFVPRDCPRVCFWPLPTTTPADHERFFGAVAGRMVIAIESAWLERLRTTVLHRYVMPEATFEDTHDHGVHISRWPVVPESVAPMGDLLVALTAANVEVRLVPSLVPLGRAIIQTTLHFSLIRMRNARDWPDAGSA